MHHKKFQIFRPINKNRQHFFVSHYNYNGDISQKWDLVLDFDWGWGVLLKQGQCVWTAFCEIFSGTPCLTIFSVPKYTPIPCLTYLDVFGCSWLYLGTYLSLPNMVKWGVPEKFCVQPSVLVIFSTLEAKTHFQHNETNILVSWVKIDDWSETPGSLNRFWSSYRGFWVHLVLPKSA